MEGREVDEEGKRGYRRALVGSYRHLGQGVGGALEDEGACPFCREGGDSDPVNHIGWCFVSQ